MASVPPELSTSSAEPAPVDDPRFAPHPSPLPSGERGQEDDSDALPEVGKVFEGPKRSMFAAFKASQQAAPKPPPSNVEPVTSGEFAQKWSAVLDVLKDKSPGVHGILSQGRLLSVEAGAAVIEVNPQVEMLVKTWDRNGRKEIINGALADTFGPGVGVQFKIGAAAEAAPTAAPSRAPAPQRPQQVHAVKEEAPPPPPPPRLTAEQVEAARQDPLVKAVLETFGGTIVKVET